MSTTAHSTYTCIGALIHGLAHAGLRHICICPGSRSTPLALASAAHPDLEIWTHIDERSAAFFALGLARATSSPVALVATSGTAVVNFMPAVTEAYYGRVPLILLTADRPHELRDVGSNQTIDQVRLFGTHTRWSVDMPLPDSEPQTIRYFQMAASRAFATSSGAPAGPVHLNLPLREPLVPPGELPLPGPGTSPMSVLRPARAPAPAELAEIATELKTTRRGLIICGPDTPADAHEPILRLAQHLAYPVLADPLSGLRTSGLDIDGGSAHSPLIDAYDAFLQHEDLAEILVPDLVIRFGAAPTSKPLNLYLQHHSPGLQMVVDPGDEWRDPTLTANRILHLDPSTLCERLLATLKGPAFGTDPGPHSWLQNWQEVNELTRSRLHTAAGRITELSEARVLQELAELIPAGASLYVGNSMPIREMDTFFPVVDRPISVYGNRGVSGIDGVVSSALGVSAGATRVSAGTAGPTLLVIGDLSFYHDLNGLLAAKLHHLDLTIVVINNDGGGIFSFLPQAELPEHFELLFGTPTGLDFQPTVEMYGGDFTRVADWEEFETAIHRGMNHPGLHVVEVVTDRARNAALRREILAGVRQELSGFVEQLALGGAHPTRTCTYHELNDARYRVQIEGEGNAPPILLLHGFTGALETWSPFTPDLARDHRTISIDLLGHGQSAAPPHPERYQMERVVADLVALLDTLEIERTTVLGYSMGGRVALHLATAAPERVHALILESASPGIEDDAERADRQRQDHALAAEIEANGVPAFVDYWENIPLFASQRSLDPAVRGGLREQRLQNSALGLANSLRGAGAGAHDSLIPHLHAITAPTLLITGELDEKYCGITYELATLIPRAEAAIIPDAGHAVHLERPAEFIAEVLTFLSTLETL